MFFVCASLRELPLMPAMHLQVLFWGPIACPCLKAAVLRPKMTRLMRGGTLSPSDHAGRCPRRINRTRRAQEVSANAAIGSITGGAVRPYWNGAALGDG